ncbi:MAG: FAD-dependent oxidoreductase [Verrucomicrobiales bacterium]|nr:FAD-dependent oxidoreductase [Verrucomicrobiales bacterium]
MMRKPPSSHFPQALAAATLAVGLPWLATAADTVLVEAESFSTTGGWLLDTQFIDQMGSPYLIAHGLGNPVADAETSVAFPKAGTYRMWVRTKNWVAKFSDPAAQGATGSAAPGRFQVVIDGKAIAAEFGATGAEWHWQDGGEVAIAGTKAQVSLHDLTGFNGRCDAILFSSDPAFKPDNSSAVLPAWRRELLGLDPKPADEGPFDIVFVGGGYAGSCGAISAARMGLKVALIQNRGVLGGNGSSEVRVWAKGNTPPGLYPVGDIIQEFTDEAKASPGTFEEFEDEKKEKIVRAEKNLSLFLHHHAYAVEMADKSHIGAVLAFDTKSGQVRRFTARNFCDATGHGTIGMLANADREMIDGGRMGMSNMWRWENASEPQTFPATPWALALEEGDFPYPRKFHAEWFWESGYDKHPLDDLEGIRDWNLRANFGAWNAMKNKGAFGRYDETGAEHRNARLTWMAYVGGTRETQQLLGDVILTEEDIVSKKPFPDGCVLTTWSVDLHYPAEQYVKKFPDNPFISKAVHGSGVDRKRGYPIPYRCFYSRNIENLFMAGRNISVTHEALGTVRVMKTCGMMGVVVGKAAAICAKHDVSPRDVYYQHLDELIDLLRLPGNMRRATLKDEFFEDPQLPKIVEPDLEFVPRSSLSGIVVDDREAKLTGTWTEGAGLPMHVEDGYHYAGPKSDSTARYEFTVPRSGEYEVRISYQPHENRASNTPVTVVAAAGEKTIKVNQKVAPPLAKSFYTLGAYRFEAGQPGAVIISTEGIDGNAHADAVQVVPLD